MFQIVHNGTKIIYKSENAMNNYFAWPTVARLQDGRLAMVCSGYRVWHVCPFGQTVISYSNDEGETWTAPAPVINTSYDDRDGGICTFGEKGVIVTSFNNSTDWIKNYWEEYLNDHIAYPYVMGYINSIEKTDIEKDATRSIFAISNDGGNTFGEVHTTPVSSPHGPLALPNGDLLYIGTACPAIKPHNKLQCYIIHKDLSSEYLSEIDGFPENCGFAEPYAILTKSGKIIVQIRVQGGGSNIFGKGKYFTLFQCESYDYGKTFTKPHQILSDRGGAPAHIIEHSSGLLISVYSYRDEPYGIKAAFSADDGETWDTDHVVCDGFPSSDLGYPASVELEDGSILTVFYAHESEDAPATIMQVKWRIQ